MTRRYRNPRYRPGVPVYGPPVYETAVRPVSHGGYLLYHRQKHVWDVVRDGVAVTQRAGLAGARRAVDELNEQEGHLNDALGGLEGPSGGG